MHYKEVVTLIKKNNNRRILITGPQRSGTTITSKIFAYELKFKHIDESEIDIDNFDQLFKVYQERDFVLQAPGLSAYAHMMPGAVIFMRRPIEEIMASQTRIGWSLASEHKELAKYFKSSGDIAKIKYEYWDNWQKNFKKGMYEVDYASIRGHKLYIPPEGRRNFSAKQTAPKKRIDGKVNNTIPQQNPSPPV